MMTSDTNRELRELQQDWYNKLPDNKYKQYDTFSSPFCFGISEKTIEERNTGKPLIMYIGEEPNNWWFEEEEQRVLEYVQGCSIAYFDRQMRKSSEKQSDYEEKYCDAYTNGVIKRNSSQFWNLLRKIKKELNCAACWNDLDKLHRIGEKRETIKLNDFSLEEQAQLHIPFNDSNQSLLLQEINLLKPDIIIFMGANYRQSIEKGLGLQENKLINKAPKLDINKTVVDISNECSEALEHSAKVLWMCHPTALTKNKSGSFYSHTIEKIIHLIKN